MTKTITYTSFVVAAILVVLAFLTARTYTQLAIAIILYPALAFFALKIFRRKAEGSPFVTIKIPPKIFQPKAETTSLKKDGVQVTDIDKRTFLKLIGAAGISFFLFSLLGRWVDILLFGRTIQREAPGNMPADNTLVPAASPTEGYKIAEIDESEVTYYGFTNKNGGWLIMKQDPDTGSFRYAKGNLNFSRNWTNRENLKYDYYYNLF